MNTGDDEHYQNGVNAFEAGRFGDAVEAFRASLDQDLNNWGARLYLGMSHFKSGDLENAAKVFRYVHQKCPHSELRLKAMNALAPIETELATGESAGSISKVLERPSDETLKRIHDEAEARRATKTEPIRTTSTEIKPKQPLPAKKQSAEVPKHTAEVAKPSAQAGSRKALIPVPVGIAIIAIALVGTAYWAGSLLIPDIFSQLLMKPSKQIGSGYSTAAPSGIEKEDVTFIGPGGVEMYGMHLQTGSKAVVMINRSTTGNLGDDWPLVEQLCKSGVSVFIYDYRGFGKSSGKPDEQGLLDDGLLAHDYLTGKLGYKKSNVILFGKGVGCGVATEIAQRREHAGVVLVSGYRNLNEVAKQRNALLGIYVADLMPQEAYDSSRWAKQHGSALLINANDPMIPAADTKRFYEQVAQPKKIETIECKTTGCDYTTAVGFIEEVSKQSAN
jgi:alpha/beta superfamily hydrolase